MKQNDWMTGKPAVRHRPCLREFTQLTVFVLPDSGRLKQRYAHFTIWPKLLWDQTWSCVNVNGTHSSALASENRRGGGGEEPRRRVF